MWNASNLSAKYLVLLSNESVGEVHAANTSHTDLTIVLHYLGLKCQTQTFIAILIIEPILYGCKTWSLILREKMQIDEVL